MSDALKDVPEVKAVASANTTFSLELFTALKESHSKNLIYSPFSLSAVVALVKVGAGGETASEIAKTFRYPVDNIVLGKGYAKVLASLQTSSEGYTLSTANRLYSSIGFKIRKEYEKSVKDNFLAEVEQLDFTKAGAAAGTINGWVEETTHGKIKNLISPDSLSPSTELILVNGIYFKGLWKDQFDPQRTVKAPFYLNVEDQVEVDMMSMTKTFPYGEFPDIGAHAVALPYKGDRLCMLIIAPTEKANLPRVEEGLKKYTQKGDCSLILGKMFEGDKVAVRLPRFKIETTLSLVPILKKMGLSTMFTGGADFSEIPQDKGRKLLVSEVIQKAFIEVNEEGSEAAAATAVRMNRSVPFIVPFDADRPFIFQIIDKHTNFVLFAGRCSNPLISN